MEIWWKKAYIRNAFTFLFQTQSDCNRGCHGKYTSVQNQWQFKDTCITWPRGSWGVGGHYHWITTPLTRNKHIESIVIWCNRIVHSNKIRPLKILGFFFSKAFIYLNERSSFLHGKMHLIIKHCKFIGNFYGS